MTRSQGRGGGGKDEAVAVSYFLLRLVKPKRILRPFSLSFLLMFSMKVWRSLVGLAGFAVIIVSLIVFQILIIAYIQGGDKTEKFLKGNESSVGSFSIYF
jgi:hypothetical protein